MARIQLATRPGLGPDEKKQGGLGGPDSLWRLAQGFSLKRLIRRGGVHKIQILIEDFLKEFLRNFFGEEIGGVKGTQAPL